MRRTTSTLNNREMAYYRREPVYEAILTDLVLIGALEKDIAEGLLGHDIAKNIALPFEHEKSAD
jgi:hypothetical protein